MEWHRAAQRLASYKTVALPIELQGLSQTHQVLSFAASPVRLGIGSQVTGQATPGNMATAAEENIAPGAEKLNGGSWVMDA
jgi:hypothetical protein